jgi:hypothetical protein
MLLKPWWFVLLYEVIVVQLDKQFYILWNPQIFHPVHKTDTVNPILSQINPAHDLTPRAFKVNSNIFLQFKPKNVELIPSSFLPLRCGLTVLHLLSSWVIRSVVLKVW